MVIEIQKLILILLRITSFIVVSPGFSFRSLPNTVKIAISFAFTVTVYSITPSLGIIDSLFLFLVLSIQEVLIGLALGFITKLIFASIEIAGQFMDFQAGFSMASVFDPTMGIQASHYGRLYYWMSICIFFILDLHHHLIRALIMTFEYIPISMIDFSGYNVKFIVDLFVYIFEIGFNLAAPILIVVLITDMVMGIISRTVPQINVLMLGMPLKSMISFVFILFLLTWIMNKVGSILYLMPDYLRGFMELFI